MKHNYESEQVRRKDRHKLKLELREKRRELKLKKIKEINE